MQQTPAHQTVNLEILSMMPLTCHRVIEVGCMHGVLAKAYRARNPACVYVGIDIEPDYVKVAAPNCTQALTGDIELFSPEIFESFFPSDCWVFGDCLEHLRDPWSLLARVRAGIDRNGCLVACIPNAQHWSVQYRLVSGNLFYEDSGLLDRTHLRWFTRLSIIKMFTETGWKIEQGLSRVLYAPQQEQPLKAIADMARQSGMDPDVAVQDAIPYQYVFKVTPA